MRNLTGIVPSNTYLTRDGEHVVIGANADSIFKRLMRVIGREDLADDASLADNAGRARRGEELDAVIGGWTAKYDEHSNLIEMAYFDEQGRPARHTDGYARLTSKYDARGQVVDKVLAKPWRPFYAPRAPARYTLETHPEFLEKVALGDELVFETHA